MNAVDPDWAADLQAVALTLKLAFVVTTLLLALGQVQPPDGSKAPGSMWLVPESLYTPLKQDVVVLAATKSRAAATAFADYLAGDKARAVIKAYGYSW